MLNPKTNPIRAAIGFSKATNTQVATLGAAVVAAMPGNPLYSNAPVDLPTLKTAVDSLTEKNALALDGGKKAVSEVHAQRQVVVKMLRLLGHHVEAHCNDDMPTFLSSGFQPLQTVKTPPQPLAQPTISKIDQGKNSGGLLVKIATVAKASSYELRYAGLAAGAALAPWTVATVTILQGAFSVDGLTPGTNYAFQVRALGRLGFTDWSDSVTRMCI